MTKIRLSYLNREANFPLSRGRLVVVVVVVGILVEILPLKLKLFLMTGRNLEDDEDALLLCLVDEDPLFLDLVLDLDDDLFSFARSFFSAASFKTAGQSHCPITHLFKTMIPVFPSSFGRLSVPDTCPIHFCHLQ